MGNLLDYLRWRGDFTLAERPFNVVDNVVLSTLAYVDLEDVAPAPGAGAISVADAAAAATARGRGRGGDRLTIADARLLDDLARTARFADAQVSGYVDVVDDVAGMQFSALTVRLDDDTTYVAFRGTDNTIMGWREDFAMSFQVTPAQIEAAHYLRAVAERSETPLRVGGHSKGGNLAVYSAMLLPREHQALLLDVYNNDGPGLSADIVDHAGLDRIRDRLTTTVPEWALIGALFATSPPTHVVRSDARGLLQHDPLTWQIEGPALSEASSISPRAAALNGAIDEWLRHATVDDRRDFTNALFGALSAGGARLTTEIARVDYGSFESVLVALARSRAQTRRPAVIALRVAARSVAAVDYRRLLHENRARQSIAFLILGVFFMVVPSLAVQIVGSVAVLVLGIWGTFRVGRYVLRFRTLHNIGWRLVTALALLLGALLAGISRLDVLVVPTNLLLGVAFLAQAWTSARRAQRSASTRPPARLRSAVLLASAIVAAILGVGALTTAGQVLPAFVQQAGAYIVVVAATQILTTARDAGRASA